MFPLPSLKAHHRTWEQSLPVLQEWYCSDHCASADWRTHKQDCKYKGKTSPGFGSVMASEESQTGENPILAALPTKASNPAPRREFRTDGTVKIINGYKPDPNMFRGANPDIAGFPN